jgi:hypothetical protein
MASADPPSKATLSERERMDMKRPPATLPKFTAVSLRIDQGKQPVQGHRAKATDAERRLL